MYFVKRELTQTCHKLSGTIAVNPGTSPKLLLQILAHAVITTLQSSSKQNATMMG